MACLSNFIAIETSIMLRNAERYWPHGMVCTLALRVSRSPDKLGSDNSLVEHVIEAIIWWDLIFAWLLLVRLLSEEQIVASIWAIRLSPNSVKNIFLSKQLKLRTIRPRILMSIGSSSNGHISNQCDKIRVTAETWRPIYEVRELETLLVADHENRDSTKWNKIPQIITFSPSYTVKACSLSWGFRWS